MANFPESWWQNKKQPLIFAHRGASLVAPENTIAAFRKAIEIGADGIELDVRLTSDKVPVVLHNAHVDKTTDGHGAVYKKSLSEVRALDAGSWFSTDYKNESIPTLEEVLCTFGLKTIINIELKSHHIVDHQLSECVCTLIQQMALEDRVWFSSFNVSLLKQTRKYLPKVPNGYLFTSRSPGNVIKALTSPIEAVHPYFKAVSKQYCTRMHRLNKRVIVWTVDDTDSALRCSDAQVDAIITNDPDKLIQVLHSY